MSGNSDVLDLISVKKDSRCHYEVVTIVVVYTKPLSAWFMICALFVLRFQKHLWLLQGRPITSYYDVIQEPRTRLSFSNSVYIF